MKYWLFFFVLSVAPRCNSCMDSDCFIPGYEFEIPATLIPSKDTYHIGDTISILSNFLNAVYDRQTEKTYTLEDFSFSPGLTVIELSGSEPDKSGVLNFQIINQDSANFQLSYFQSGSVLYHGEYNYIGSAYHLECHLIPKKSGLYYLSFGSSINAWGGNQSFEGKCQDVDIDAFVKLNDGASNNIALLKNSPDPHYNTWIVQKPEDRFHKFGGYCFYVVE